MNNKIESIILEVSESIDNKEKLKNTLEILDKINPEIKAPEKLKDKLESRIISMAEYKRPNFLKSNFGILKIFSGSIAFCFSIFFLYLLFWNNTFNKPFLDEVPQTQIQESIIPIEAISEGKKPMWIIFDEKSILEKQEFSKELEKVNNEANKKTKKESSESNEKEPEISKKSPYSVNEKNTYYEENNDEDEEEESFLVPDEEVSSDENIQTENSETLPMLKMSPLLDQNNSSSEKEADKLEPIQTEILSIQEKTFEEFTNFCNGNWWKMNWNICTYSNKSCSFSGFKNNSCE